MKIASKIILSHVLSFIIIFMIGAFALESLNPMIAKLRFIEIADDLNIVFLEMRLSEKNYFLYKDENALSEISAKIKNTRDVIDSYSDSIIKVVGEGNFNTLEAYLDDYAKVVNSLNASHVRDKVSETRLRNAGKRLKDFSDEMTRLERHNINAIIFKSHNALFYSFFAILALVFVIGQRVSVNIVRPIKNIEEMANSISAGNFKRKKTALPKDEIGSVIRAINHMSEEISNRQEQIIQSKKLASMGILIAGVAHEINNPLNNISMIAETYEDMYEKLSPEQRMEFMGKVESETVRIKGIVKNLLDFAKPKEPERISADINEVVNKTLKLVQNMLNVSDIEVGLNLAEELPLVYVDVPQIQQVFVNLITNAIQAMPDGGKLNISTRLGKEPDTIETGFLDSGKGIPQEFLAHVFDPFFSTKEEGGMGLGLWVSYGIVKSQGGNILVESKVGTGTIFTVQLPVYKEKGEIE